MRRGVVLAAALLASGCSGPRVLTPLRAEGAGTAAAARAAAARTGRISHVVFIVQENRSFNNLFMGFPGAVTQNYGYDTSGEKVPLHPQTIATAWDIDHSFSAFLTDDDDGKLDGWNGQYACCGKIPPNFAYAYVPRDEIRPYWDLAKQYVLADHTFASNLDGSFVAHQYIIAAYASRTVDYPNGEWGCRGGRLDIVPTLNADRTYGLPVRACFNHPTLGQEADALGVSWRFYTSAIKASGGLWSSYQAIRHVVNGPDWDANVVNPQAQFLTDVASGKLANITWITPTYEDSDHAGFSSNVGPAWVSSVVDAVGESPFWNSTAIFLVWDDWGGWFDPVAPVYEDYDGLGFRIPLLMISPYARRGYVSHVQYETSSVLRFMEDTFGLGQLAASDTRAADPASDAFDFSRPPRPFVPIGGARSAAYWFARQGAAQQRAKPPVDGD